MESTIFESIQAALTRLGAGNISFTVERPTDSRFGDYATNAALAAAKMLGKNPREVADEIVLLLKESLGDRAARIEVAGPGFINVMLSRSAVTLLVAEADAKGAEWGRSESGKGKRIFIEYSNPNAFKEMHVGHLVGTIVGEALSRLAENTGAEVARDTFGGDVGPNVAKALWSLQKKQIIDPTVAEIGAAYTEGAQVYESDPAIRQEIDALNQAIYKADDSQLMALWRKGRDVSMEEFRRIWRLLGTTFDFEFFDSDTTEAGMRIVQDGLEKGVFEHSDGAIIYNGEKKGVHTMVFITSHNTPTYETKDLGLAFFKEERWPSDQVIIVTGNEQTGRFKTVLAALSEIAPRLAEKTLHIGTGFLKLASGKMSSREGNVITATAFIQEVAKEAGEKNPDPLVAGQVAVGAIKYMILRQAPGSDIIFDAEKSLSLVGDSGPYLQYALVRARSVLVGAGATASAGSPEVPYLIERLIMHFPEVAARAACEHAPNLLVNYLTELAGEWNAFYAKERILGGEFESHKLLVARAFSQTMQNGLALLGIPTPEKM